MSPSMKWMAAVSASFFLLAGCSGVQSPHSPPLPRVPVGSVRKEPPAPNPPVIGERPPDALRLSLDVWRMRGNKVYRGWPLLLEVSVGHPDAWLAEQEGRTPTPLRIISPSGGWDSLVKVRLFGPGRTELTLPLVQVARPEGALVLDAEAPVHTLRWHLGPEGTREGGWTGRLHSMVRHFEVEDEPSPLPPELAESKATLFAQYALYRGNPAEAQAILEAYLATQPDSPSLRPGVPGAAHGEHRPAPARLRAVRRGHQCPLAQEAPAAASTDGLDGATLGAGPEAARVSSLRRPEAPPRP